MSAGAATAAGFNAPGPIDFFLPDFTGASYGPGWMPVLTKPAALLLIAGVLTVGLLWLGARRGALVPSRGQYLGEQAYAFIRDGAGRDVVGGADFMRWVPLLVSLFFFLLLNNLFGVVPFFQFPPFSRVSYAYGLAAMVWVIFNGVGVITKGPLGYLKHASVPSGVPWYLIWLVAPLEFLSNVIVRPITLSLRLFANMFAGHLLIILFSTGGAYLLIHATGNVILKPAGVLAFLLGIAIGFLEIIVAVLQAYVFTLLTASYISGAVSSEH